MMELYGSKLQNYFKNKNSYQNESSAGDQVADTVEPIENFVSKRSLEPVSEISEEMVREIIEENESLTIRLANEIRKNNQLRNSIVSITNENPILRSDGNVMEMLKMSEEQRPTTCDKCCQTWSGILCGACKDTAAFRKELERIQLQKLCEGPVIEVKKCELDAIYENVTWLKNHFARNAYVTGFNIDKAKKSLVAEEVTELKRVLNAKRADIVSLRTQLKNKVEEGEKFESKKQHLKRIVVKLARRHYRLLKRLGLHESSSDAPIDDDEKKFIRSFVAKQTFGQTAGEPKTKKTKRQLGKPPTVTLTKRITGTLSLHDRSSINNTSKSNSNSSSTTTKKDSMGMKSKSSVNFMPVRSKTSPTLKAPRCRQRDDKSTRPSADETQQQQPPAAKCQRKRSMCPNCAVPRKRTYKEVRQNSTSSGSDSDSKNKSETWVAKRRPPKVLAKNKHKEQCARSAVEDVDGGVRVKLKKTRVLQLEKNPSY